MDQLNDFLRLLSAQNDASKRDFAESMARIERMHTILDKATPLRIPVPEDCE